jgi:hypothetical protein
MDGVEQRSANSEQRMAALKSSIEILADNFDTGLTHLQESLQKQQQLSEQNDHIRRVSNLQALMGAFKIAPSVSTFYDIHDTEIPTLYQEYLIRAKGALASGDHDLAKLMLLGKLYHYLSVRVLYLLN